MKKAKRNIIIVAVLLFVCAAVYLNWSYNNRWGQADQAMVDAEDAAMEDASDAAGTETEDESAVSEYFAQARLTRQTSRDEALNLLQTAASSEGASQETIDAAMNAIAAMATYSMEETQIENMLIAKDFADCVVYMSADSVTVAVPAPAEGLSEAAVARVMETVLSETGYDATQVNVIPIRDGAAADTADAMDAAADPAADVLVAEDGGETSLIGEAAGEDTSDYD